MNHPCSSTCWCELDDIPTVEPKIHIRVQQRNSRQRVTTIEGLDRALDYKRLLKFMKKNLNCNGTVAKHDELGYIIQLQGDHREKVFNMLKLLELVSSREELVVHGG